MLPIPTTITHSSGEIKLIEILGNGGFSYVYCGSIGGNYVAVKVGKKLDNELKIMNSIMTSENLNSHFSNAISTLPQLLLHGYCGLNDIHYFAIEKYAMTFKEFRNRHNNGNNTTHIFDIHNVTKNVLSALHYLARYKVIHLDIKSANIMLRNLNDTSRCVLIDFGSAQIETSFFTTQFVYKEKVIRHKASLTPLYAPLSIHESSNLSLVDDVESLYYNIFEWSTGSLPWKSKCSNLDALYTTKKLFFTKHNFNLTIETQLRRYLERFYQTIIDSRKTIPFPYESLYRNLDVIVTNYVENTQVIDESCNNEINNNNENFDYHTNSRGMNTQEKCIAHNRLNYKISHVLSLIKGLISLVKFMKRNIKQKAVVLSINLPFIEALKEILSRQISRTGHTQYFLNAIDELKELTYNNIEELVIIYVKPNFTNSFVEETMMYYDEIVDIHRKEVEPSDSSNLHNLLYGIR
uniref:non-specific serine/threonine protein kinase n=1 Tax=Strongyloides papillosus TaxID=174720 RepID=A0A0N5BD47_STREA